jgi:hypothetical protein
MAGEGWSFNVDFPFAHGNAAAQHIGHGALMVREQTAVGAEHSIRSAKPFIRIDGMGSATTLTANLYCGSKVHLWTQVLLNRLATST